MKRVYAKEDITMTATEGLSQPQKIKELEKVLLHRKKIAIPAGWEREMVRGYVHTFDQYRLPLRSLGGEEEMVVIQEDSAMIATRIWDCAVLTSKFIEHVCADPMSGTVDLVTGLNLKQSLKSPKQPIQVLELGAGTGLLSICLAKMGAAVLSTEYGPVVRYLENNCQMNKVLPEESATSPTLMTGKVRCRELDWFKEAESLQSMFKEGERAVFDLVIVTDCSLTERDTKGVFKMIDKFSTPGQTKVIVGVCIQREGTPLTLQKAKAYSGYREVQVSDLHPAYTSSRFHILTFDA